MSGLLLVFALLALAIILYLLTVLWLVMRRRQRIRVLVAFSERMNGALVKRKANFPGLPIPYPQGVTFCRPGAGGRPSIQLVLDEVGGEWSGHYLHLTFDLPQPTSFLCRVYPQILVPKLGKLLYTRLWGRDEPEHHVQTGWGPFDDEFVVKASDELEARAVLGGEVQQLLLRLKQWTRERWGRWNVSDGLVIDRASLQFRISPWRLPSTEDLMTFYAFCQRIYDGVCKAFEERSDGHL